MIVNFIDFNDDGTLKVSPELYTIKPFSLLLEEIKDANLRVNVLSYVYWSGLVGSHYYLNVIEDDIIALNDASDRIKEDVGLPKEWTPSPTVYSCVNKWKELQQTASLSALKATEGAIKALKKYLTSIDLNEVVPNGKNAGLLLHDPKKVSSVAKELASLTDIFMKQEKQVIAEYSEKMKIRGGGVIGLRENR